MKLIPVHMDNINKTKANKTLFKKSKRYLSDSDSEMKNQYITEKFLNFIIIQSENTQSAKLSLFKIGKIFSKINPTSLS